MTKQVATAIVILITAAITSAIPAGDDKQPPYKITSKRDDDRVDVKAEKGKATFSIHSPFGISHAAIERGGEEWPEAVEGSASIQDGKPLVRLWKDGKEDAPLDAKSPYWMEVRTLGGDGKQAKEIPLKGGCFEMQLPKAFFEGNPKAITVNWIDFYRN